MAVFKGRQVQEDCLLQFTASDLCLEREKVQWKYIIKTSWQLNLDKAIGNIGKWKVL